MMVAYSNECSIFLLQVTHLSYYLFFMRLLNIDLIYLQNIYKIYIRQLQLSS